MNNLIITALDHMSPNLAHLAQALRDTRPAMTQIREEIFRPLVGATREQTPFRSGNLRQSIQSWVKKNGKATGMGIYHGPDNLGYAKASLLLKGRKAHTHKKKEKFRRLSRKGNEFEYENPGSPWGDIKKRKFFPTKNNLMAQTPRIEQIIAEYLRTAAEGQ